MNRRQFRLERIRGVERQYEAASLAITSFTDRLRTDPTALGDSGLAMQDVQELRANLEATYLIRLFAEFEATLREAWRRAYGRRSRPAMEQLMNSIAARCLLPQDWNDDAHEVRQYRNALVHEESDQIGPITVPEARKRLSRFVSRLPLDW